MESNDSYQSYMREAFQEAKRSLQTGNKGFGAVMVKGGGVIARAHDTEETDQDPTAHAEMKAIREASRLFGKDLAGCVLVSTHEPCPMCATATVWAKVSTLVYGYGIKDALEQGRRRIDLGCREIVQRAGAATEVVSGVLRDECAKLYAEDIREHVKRFLGMDREKARGLEAELLAKRLRWLRENPHVLEGLTGDDLDQAYQLLCLKLGIGAGEAPVVEKSGRRIVFHSGNYCPSLEACKLLDLDTSEVCRWVYEKPTEALVQGINPRLRFSRSYHKLRPAAGYCEEYFYLE
ncbi:MAG: nucleoside deaminase [Firmicutes bacterium]|nr:nucleoside deaminase [Bacillota bacterium]